MNTDKFIVPSGLTSLFDKLSVRISLEDNIEENIRRINSDEYALKYSSLVTSKHKFHVNCGLW